MPVVGLVVEIVVVVVIAGIVVAKSSGHRCLSYVSLAFLLSLILL